MTDPYRSTNRSTYDRIAPLYRDRQLQHWASGEELFGSLERRWLTSLPSGGRVADLGCGPALDSQRFARAGFQVVGVDLSSGMLRLAAERLPGRLVQADLRALPLPEATLQGIWCAAALLHVPEDDTELVLREFRHGLASGGVLALVTALGEGSHFEPVPYAKEEQRWFVYRSRDRLERQLSETGFRITFSDVVRSSRLWHLTAAERSG